MQDNPTGTRVSIVHIHSVGIVAKNMELGSTTIEVNPTEDTPMMDGEITDNMGEASIRSKDSEGGFSDVKVASTATIPAKWMPFGSNRFTPPNVRRGEKVLIWRIGDSDTYYWSEYEYDPKLRKLETVIFLFSDTRKEDEEASPENSWFVEVSTHRKIIHVHTGTNDGEPFAFDIQLDAALGNFLLMNDQEDQFSLNSKEKCWTIINADGTYVLIDKQDIKFYAPQNISFECGGNLSYKVGGAMSHNVTGAWSWQSANVSGKAGGASYNIPETSYSGLVAVGGFSSRNDSGHGFNVSGSGTFTGSLDLTDTLQVGSINASGNIVAAGTVSGSNI